MTDDVVEFKGEFYNIPASKIGPKPLQKPHPPIYMGVFSPKAFGRIVNYADGWIGVAGGPLEYLANGIKTLRDQAIKANRDPNELKNVIAVFPQIVTHSTKDSSSSSQRLSLSGTIDEIGGDIRKIKEMGAEHIIFGFIDIDLEQTIDIAKQLAKFAR